MSAESVALPDRAVGLVAHAARDVRVEPVPVRAPGPDDAVVEVVYGGICGSDLHYWQHGAAGLSILREPMLPPGNQPVPVATAIARELELVGSFRFIDEIDHVLRALADGSLDVDAVITHEYPVDDALTALATAADPVRSGKVLLTFDPAVAPNRAGPPR